MNSVEVSLNLVGKILFSLETPPVEIPPGQAQQSLFQLYWDQIEALHQEQIFKLHLYNNYDDVN